MGPLRQTVDALASSSPPWWAQPRHIVGAVIGLLVAVAGILVWLLMAIVVTGHRELSAAHHHTQQSLERHIAGEDRLLILLELICRNTAPSDRQAAQCDVARR